MNPSRLVGGLCAILLLWSASAAGQTKDAKEKPKKPEIGKAAPGF